MRGDPSAGNWRAVSLVVLAAIIGLVGSCSGDNEGVAASDTGVEAVPSPEDPRFDRWIVEESDGVAEQSMSSATTVDRAPREVPPSTETVRAVAQLEAALPEAAGFSVVSIGEVLTDDGRSIHLSTLRSATSVLKAQWQHLDEPLRLIPRASVEDRAELGSYTDGDDGELLTVNLDAQMSAGSDDYRLYYVTAGGEMTSLNFVTQSPSDPSTPPSLTLEQLTALVTSRWGMDP